MTRRIHSCLSVEGWLSRAVRATKAERKRITLGMTDDAGRPLTFEQAYEAMLQELAQGHRMLPVGKACEGFSYETGCPGHEIADGDQGVPRG